MLPKLSGRAVKFFTFRRDAVKAEQPGQHVRFTKGRGYWLFGKILRRPRPITMFASRNSGPAARRHRAPIDRRVNTTKIKAMGRR